MSLGVIRKAWAIKKVEEKILGKKADFIRSRKGASMILASATLIGSIFISSNLSVVKVIDGDQSNKVVTAKSNSSVEIIRQAGFALSDNDAYSVNSTDDAVKAIKIIRAFDMKVLDCGEEKTISAVNGTVGEALKNAGIALPGSDDKISVDLSAEAVEDMVVRIDRVKFVTESKTKAVKFKTVIKNDKTLASGKTKVSVEGVNGEKVVTTVKKYVNGKLTDTSVSEKVTKKAVDKVVLKGTKKADSVKNKIKSVITSDNSDSKTLTINGKEVSYSKVLTGPGTAYTARSGARTATGRAVKVGLVAVDPRKIPYGTRLYITSADGSYTYGYAIAADTGGALRSGRVLVDLFYNTERECVNFGRRQVKVYILD